MKNKIKMLSVGILLFSLGLFSTGCSSLKSTSPVLPPIFTNDNVGESMPSEVFPSYVNNVSGRPSDTPEENVKVILSYTIDLETKEFDKSVENIEEITTQSSGYVQSHNIRTHERNNQVYKFGEMTLRVPKDKVDMVLKVLKAESYVISESSDSTDVTNQYYDVEASIKSLEAQESKLNELYKKATTIEDIITVDNKLTQVIKDKENLTRTFLDLQNRTELTSIYITLEEVTEYSLLESAQISFGDKLANAFTNSFKVMGNATLDFVVILASVFPLLIILGIGAFLFIKYNNKKKRK